MLVPFTDANRIGDRFLELLSRLEIDPPLRSNLEDELLSLTELIEVTKNPNLVQDAKRCDIVRAAAGIHDLAAKVLSLEGIQEFREFIPHLQLISSNKVKIASVSQIQSSEHDDDTARKMAELYIGCLAAHVGTGVILDSPIAAKGDNPDVIFMAHPQNALLPTRWALAIKTISSRQGQTIFERIRDGVRQINADRCPCDKGMVIINAKNALDHDRLWGLEFCNLDDAICEMNRQIENLISSSQEGRPQQEWDDLFHGRAVRPVLFMGQSVVRIPKTAQERIPTALKILKVFDANNVLDSEGCGIAFHMNEFMQKILLGIPGSQGQFPR